MEQHTFQIELFVSCKNLADLDGIGKSDPAVWLFALHNDNSRTCLGRTETIQNNLNPEFTRSFIVDYCFELRQPVAFWVLDIDSKKEERMEDHQVIGVVQTTLGEIMGSRNQSLELTLTNPVSSSNCGTILIRAERVGTLADDWLTFTVSGSHLDKKDLFGKSDPYMRFLRLREDGTWVLVHQTDYMRNTLDPQWPPLSLSIQKLCNGDLDRPVSVEVFDWDAHSDHDLIGTCQVTVRRILEQPGIQVDVVHPEKRRSKGDSYRNSGVLSFQNASVRRMYSFLDFLRSGWQLSMAVAIDFTGSNGNPADSSSLHYRNPNGQFNEYQHAIASIGQILEPYDYDKLFPVYGFGGLIDGHTSHCFPLTSDASNPCVRGVSGILDVYNKCVASVPLSGPTYFTEVINTVAAAAAEHRQQRQTVYTVLLIITDGEICDMDETTNAIVAASQLPMSIIIVGVGNEGFQNMRRLDADEGGFLRASNGARAVRDIVQFVPLKKHKHSFEALARETLAEVPKQLTQFMTSNNIVPNMVPPGQAVATPVAEHK